MAYLQIVQPMQRKNGRNSFETSKGVLVEYYKDKPMVRNNGKVVLLIPGWTCEGYWEYYKQAIELTKHEYTVLTINNPGTGNSTFQETASEYLGTCIWNALRLLENEGEGKKMQLHIVGHSMGGGIATGVAKFAQKMHNIELLSLSLIAPANVGDPAKTLAGAIGKISLNLLKFLNVVIKRDNDRVGSFVRFMTRATVKLSEFISTWQVKRENELGSTPEFRKEVLDTNKEFWDNVNTMAKRNPAAVIVPVINMIRIWREIADAMAEINVPTTVFTGKFDPLVAPHTYDVIREINADVELELFRSGHFPHIEDPKETNQRLIQFMQNAERRSD
ncbi:alpha/beta hydrolase [Candidatus Micrarchaeota archaeon]|nr:alpha/beta hydrolase [Candidatus Micrarchaeota archaeon]